MTDFADIARPHLDSLTDDPDRGPPEVTNPIDSPLDLSDPPRLLTDNEVAVSSAGPSAEDVTAAREAFPVVGIDVLAFYKSFRFVHLPPFRGKWGIFLIDAGIAAAAAEFREHEPALPMSAARQLAWQMLLEHERFHFWIDAWALAQEVVPIQPKRKCYEYYFAHKQGVALTKYDLEESLANAFTFRRLARQVVFPGMTAGPLLRAFMKQCPTPYDRFDLDADCRRRMEGCLAGSVMNGLSPVVQAILKTGDIEDVLSHSVRPSTRSVPLSDKSACPTYVVDGIGYSRRISPALRLPTLKELRKFVTSYLAGKKVKRRRAGHDYYQIDNGKKVRFPNEHDETTKRHEFKNILFNAGMFHREFLEARQLTNRWKDGCPRAEPKPPLNVG